MRDDNAVRLTASEVTPPAALPKPGDPAGLNA